MLSHPYLCNIYEWRLAHWSVPALDSVVKIHFTAKPPSRVAQAEMLLTCIQKASSSNLCWDTNHPAQPCISHHISRQILGWHHFSHLSHSENTNVNIYRVIRNDCQGFKMQPHVISFYGIMSRIRFMFLLFPQVSRNWRYESEPPVKPSPLTCYKRTRLSCWCL